VAHAHAAQAHVMHALVMRALHTYAAHRLFYVRINSDMPTDADDAIAPYTLPPKCNITHRHVAEQIDSDMSTFNNERPIFP
jgi:hypothetical protein